MNVPDTFEEVVEKQDFCPVDIGVRKWCNKSDWEIGPGKALYSARGSQSYRPMSRYSKFSYNRNYRYRNNDHEENYYYDSENYDDNYNSGNHRNIWSSYDDDDWNNIDEEGENLSSEY